MARIINKGYSYDDLLIVPKYNKILSRSDVKFRTRVSKNHMIDIPIIAANMGTVCESKMAIAIGKMGGLGVIHRFLTIEDQMREVQLVKKEGLLVGAAIGIKEHDFKERVPFLEKAGVDILVLDVAHGHSKRTGKTLDWIKENHPKIDVMVGIGPGAVCTTRIMTGAGVPQITALMDVYEATQGRVPVCADGGIKMPGDLTKAIGAGADTVMLGSLFAGTDETPGEIIEQDGKKFKEYRGMASYRATVKKMKLDGKEITENVHVEGAMTLMPYKGNVKTIVDKLLGGLASGMTYTGSADIESLRGKADFIEITSAGMNESVAHGAVKPI